MRAVLYFRDLRMRADLGAQRLHHDILLHAQIVDCRIIIEADMTEDLTQLLIEAGKRREDILSGRKRDRLEAEQAAAAHPAA